MSLTKIEREALIGVLGKLQALRTPGSRDLVAIDPFNESHDDSVKRDVQSFLDSWVIPTLVELVRDPRERTFAQTDQLRSGAEDGRRERERRYAAEAVAMWDVIGDTPSALHAELHPGFPRGLREGDTVELLAPVGTARVLDGHEGQRFPVKFTTPGTSGPVAHIWDEQRKQTWSIPADGYRYVGPVSTS